MDKELIYEFKINLFDSNGKLFKVINFGEFDFPTEKEIQAAIEDNGADSATIERVYRMGEIPFT